MYLNSDYVNYSDYNISLRCEGYRSCVASESTVNTAYHRAALLVMLQYHLINLYLTGMGRLYPVYYPLGIFLM